MKRDQFVAVLRTLGACSDPGDAVPWAESLPAETTAAEAWALCSRGDWLVWLIGALHIHGLISRQTLVLAACAAARTALCHVAPGEDRSRIAIEKAEAWALGKITKDSVFDVVPHHSGITPSKPGCFAASAAMFAASSVSSESAVLAYEDLYVAAYHAADAAVEPDAWFCGVAYAASQGRQNRLAEIADAVRSAVPWSTVESAVARLCEGGVS